MGDDVARTGQIQTAIWNPGSWFRDLTPGGQRLYLYLTTNADRAVTGVQPLRPKKWAQAAAGLTVDQVLADLDDLVSAGRAVADFDTDEVMIRWYMQDTGVVNVPNWRKAVPDARNAVESAKIRRALDEEISADHRLAGEFQGTLFDGMAEGLFDGSVNGYTEGSPEGRANGYKPKTLSPNTQNLKKGGTRGRASDPPGLDRFDEFYGPYPRHTARAEALKAWGQMLRAGHDPDVMIAGVQRFAADPNLPEKQFIKHPASWLRAECWTDDPMPPKFNPNGYAAAEDGVAPWA